MQGLYTGFQLGITRCRGFDQQGNFLSLFNLALPAIGGNTGRQLIDTGCKPALYKRMRNFIGGLLVWHIAQHQQAARII